MIVPAVDDVVGKPVVDSDISINCLHPHSLYTQPKNIINAICHNSGNKRHKNHLGWEGGVCEEEGAQKPFKDQPILQRRRFFLCALSQAQVIDSAK